jgi:hypothetical protein
MSLRRSGQGNRLSSEGSLALLIERLTARLHAGEPVRLAQVQEQHPEHAATLAEVWPALEALAELERSLLAGVPQSLNSPGPTPAWSCPCVWPVPAPCPPCRA